MPKGEVSHDQLSQLLFVYIGIASDIMDLFILFNESYVIRDDTITYIILAAWSFSLVQFTLVLTATKGAKTRAVGTVPLSDNSNPEDADGGCKCCETEVWSILTAMFMQDAPFLAIRLYVMIKNRTLTYGILFYTFKNALILGMQLYRLGVVMGNHYGKKDDSECDENIKKQSTGAIDIEIASDGEPSPTHGNGKANADISHRIKKTSRQEPNGVVT